MIKNNCRYLPAALLTVTILTSCLTPRKIDRWIEHEYGATVQTRPRKSNYIKVIQPQSADNVIARTEKRKMKMIPAILYWQWEYGTISTFNEQVPLHTFQQTFIPYANGKGLKRKLNGQTIELKVENMPATFSLVDKGGLIFVIWVISWERIFVDPQKENMVVSYRILDNGKVTKKGVITVEDRNKPVNVKVYRSVKKTFWEYLATYTGNIQMMSKEVADKLIKEIES